MEEKKKIQVALIGVGNHAIENLIPALKTVDTLQIKAVSSRDIEKARALAYQFDIDQAADSYDELLNYEEIDGYIASATPGFHEELLNKAVALNKNVFVEKPPFENLSNLEKFYSELESSLNKPVVQFGFNFRYSDFYKKLEELTENFINTKFVKIRSYSSKPIEPMWDYTDVLSSSLYAIHIHAIEMLCYTLGEVERVHTHIQWISDNRYIANVVVNFKGGRMGVLELSNCSNKFEFDVEVTDEDLHTYKVEGFNKFSLYGPTLQHGGVFKGKEEIVYETPFLKGGFERTGYSNQFKKFISDIQNKKLDIQSLLSCREAYKIIQSIINL